MESQPAASGEHASEGSAAVATVQAASLPCGWIKPVLPSANQAAVSPHLPVVALLGGSVRAQVPSERRVNPSAHTTHILPLCWASARQLLKAVEHSMQNRQWSIPHCKRGRNIQGTNVTGITSRPPMWHQVGRLFPSTTNGPPPGTHRTAAAASLAVTVAAGHAIGGGRVVERVESSACIIPC